MGKGIQKRSNGNAGRERMSEKDRKTGRRGGRESGERQTTSTEQRGQWRVREGGSVRRAP